MYLLYIEFLNLSKFLNELGYFILELLILGGSNMEEIINNIMQSPENTNPNVLRS